MNAWILWGSMGYGPALVNSSRSTQTAKPRNAESVAKGVVKENLRKVDFLTFFSVRRFPRKTHRPRLFLLKFGCFQKRRKTPKMDGEKNGRPENKMNGLGFFPLFLETLIEHVANGSLVGWWFHLNHLKKYARQIGSFCPGDRKQKCFKSPPRSLNYA